MKTRMKKTGLENEWTKNASLVSLEGSAYVLSARSRFVLGTAGFLLPCLPYIFAFEMIRP
jgi:hypothetical protein